MPRWAELFHVAIDEINHLFKLRAHCKSEALQLSTDSDTSMPSTFSCATASSFGSMSKPVTVLQQQIQLAHLTDEPGVRAWRP